jgi:outer membrane protein assembly factor BamB
MKIFSVLLLLIAVFNLNAQIPQFRGPLRTGHYPDTGLLKQWPENGPELLLEIKGIGKGWSSAVVANGKIYITGMINNTDYLSCVDMQGKILWKTPIGKSWNQSFPDSRSTPTIRDGKAYVSSGLGTVTCVNINDGSVIWTVDAFAEYQGTAGNWGIAESILLIDNKAIFTTGGNQTTIVALDAETGKEIWKSPSLKDNIAYVSPILIEYNGKRQIIGVGATYIYGVNPETGEIVWTFDFLNADPSEWDNAGGVINCTSPLFRDGVLFVTGGYNHTSVNFKLKDDLSGADFLWKDELLDNHHGGVVLVGDYVYGSNWINNGKGDWCCINFKTGENKYQETFKNKGSIIEADGMLYIYTEQPGFVGLVKPNPEKFELVSSFQITKGNGPHWAHPSIYDGKLYIRHGEVILVYNIKE